MRRTLRLVCPERHRLRDRRGSPVTPTRPTTRKTPDNLRSRRSVAYCARACDPRSRHERKFSALSSSSIRRRLGVDEIPEDSGFARRSTRRRRGSSPRHEASAQGPPKGGFPSGAISNLRPVRSPRPFCLGHHGCRHRGWPPRRGGAVATRTNVRRGSAGLIADRPEPVPSGLSSSAARRVRHEEAILRAVVSPSSWQNRRGQSCPGRCRRVCSRIASRESRESQPLLRRLFGM